MGFHEDNEIFLSQLLSGMLLFKREISDKELCNVMTLFDSMRYDIIDEDSIYDEVYKYIENYGNGYRIPLYYDYNSFVLKNGKKMFLDDFLISNTTSEIIEILSKRVYPDLKVPKKRVEYVDYDVVDKINSFIKSKVLSKKKSTNAKHGIV